MMARPIKRTANPAVCVLALVLAGSIGLQYQIDGILARRFEETEPHLQPPNAAAVKIASLGYYDLVADIYWLQAIQYASTMISQKKVPHDLVLAALFITDLDPDFEFVYIFTGVILTMNGGNAEEIEQVLNKGRQYLPHSWQIAFYLGFVQYFLLHKYEEAAENLEFAAELSGYSYYAVLASRIRAEGGNPRLSIAFLEQILRKSESLRFRHTVERRIKELYIIEHLQFLNSKLESYESLYGRRATSWNDLFRTGLLRPTEMPAHPLQGYYFIAPNTGRAESSVKVSPGVYLPAEFKNR